MLHHVFTIAFFVCAFTTFGQGKYFPPLSELQTEEGIERNRDTALFAMHYVYSVDWAVNKQLTREARAFAAQWITKHPHLFIEVYPYQTHLIRKDQRFFHPLLFGMAECLVNDRSASLQEMHVYGAEKLILAYLQNGTGKNRPLENLTNKQAEGTLEEWIKNQIKQQIKENN